MRLRNVKNALEIVNNSTYTINDPSLYKGNYNRDVFKNNNPIHLEIGMGKGDFIIEKALTNPDINFIGIERYESVLVRAIEKLEDKEIPNLKLICGDAKYLNDYFRDEIDCIYLNFSDPWPKKRHAKRRLTSHTFLPIYDKVFRNECLIIQKTDNLDLFLYSLESLKDYGYIIKEESYDYNSEDNIMTEYEKKFRNMGIKINYLKARKNK